MSSLTVRRARIFMFNWTLAVLATVCAFVVHLALRGRTVELGYELGHARQDQARLREVRRVLELESASYKTPERVEIVARTLLGMEPPSPDRIVALSPMPPAPAPAPGPVAPQAAGPSVDAPVVGLNGPPPAGEDPR